MWLPTRAFELFRISQDTVTGLREELAATRSELVLTKAQLQHSQTSFDWLKSRVNALEIERAQLMQKAYGISVPVPEVVRTTVPMPASNMLDLNSALFEDIGDDAARELGQPIYGLPKAN